MTSLVQRKGWDNKRFFSSVQDKKQTKQINKNDGEIERRSLYNNTIKAVLSCMEQSSSNLLWPGLVIGWSVAKQLTQWFHLSRRHSEAKGSPAFPGWGGGWNLLYISIDQLLVFVFSVARASFYYHWLALSQFLSTFTSLRSLFWLGRAEAVCGMWMAMLSEVIPLRTEK